MTSSASQPYSVDGRYIKKVGREITASEYLKEKIDAIPEVVDNVHDRSTDKALSANMGRLLQDQIDELKTPGKFLANWNSATGLSEVSLPDDPYVYGNGDYFVVSVVSQTTNYKPEGIMYTEGVASQTVETETIGIDDRYMFNGNEWVLIPASQRQIAIDQALSSTSTNPVENRVIKAKIDSMDADIEDKANASSGATGEQPAGNPGDIYVDEDEDKIYIKGVDSWKDISEQGAVYTAGEGIEITENNVINCTVDGAVYTAGDAITISSENEISVDGSVDWHGEVKHDITLQDMNRVSSYINPSNQVKSGSSYYSYLLPITSDMTKIEFDSCELGTIYAFVKTYSSSAVTYATGASRIQANANAHIILDDIPSDATNLYFMGVGAAAQNVYLPDNVEVYKIADVHKTIVDRVEDLEDAVYQEQVDTKNGFKGKIISIMGDSISTFAGWIPVADGHNLTHRARYPQANLFTDVKYCWWYKLINNLGAKLGINDSWAGSRVHNNSETNSGDQGPDACMASMTRITNLGSNGTPDLIIYYGGTNDCGAYITPGTFDSSVNYNTVDLTTYKWNNFADAYRDSIMRMQYFYPLAKIVVLLPTYTTAYYTLPELDTYNDLIKEICDYFGVPRFDLRECGINWQNKGTTLGDGIHPSILGADMIERFVRAKILSTYSLEEGENVTYTVTNTLPSGVTTDMPHIKAVSKGKSYTATLTHDSPITVAITMGGADYSDRYDSSTGVISIASVTGDIEIVVTADSTMTSYIVNHYQQNVDGSTYPQTPTDTQTISVAKGSTVTPAVNTYTGFTSPATQTITVQDDGSTVVTYHYTRNQYQLSFDTSGGSAIATQSVYYNADIVIPETTKAGYHLPSDLSQAWTNYPTGGKMPASDLQLVANWIQDGGEPTITWYDPHVALANWTGSTGVNVAGHGWVNRPSTDFHPEQNVPINMVKFNTAAFVTSGFMELCGFDAIGDTTPSTSVLYKTWTTADRDSNNIVTLEFDQTIQANYIAVFPQTQPGVAGVLTYTTTAGTGNGFYTDVPVSRRERTPWTLSGKGGLHIQYGYKQYN